MNVSRVSSHIYSKVSLYSGDYAFAGVLGVIQRRRYKRSHMLILFHYRRKIFDRGIPQGIPFDEDTNVSRIAFLRKFISTKTQSLGGK